MRAEEVLSNKGSSEFNRSSSVTSDEVMKDAELEHPREGNNLADGLARMGHGLDFGTVFFEEPPLDVRDIFDADSHGLVCLRQGSISSVL